MKLILYHLNMESWNGVSGACTFSHLDVEKNIGVGLRNIDSNMKTRLIESFLKDGVKCRTL